MIRATLHLFLVLSFLVTGSLRAQQTDISPAEFAKGIQKPEVQILDVRTLSEYNREHLKNALLADWTQFEVFKERVKSIDKEKPVYVYCLSGSRSSEAAARLRKEGFREVYHLQGGIMSWKKAKMPLEGKPEVDEITMDQYLSQIPHNKTVLVDIGAVWCAPCKKMEPVIKEVLNKKGAEVMLIKIDGGVQEKLAGNLKAESFPTFIIYKRGKEVWRHTGLVSEEILLQQLD